MQESAASAARLELVVAAVVSVWVDLPHLDSPRPSSSAEAYRPDDHFEALFTLGVGCSYVLEIRVVVVLFPNQLDGLFRGGDVQYLGWSPRVLSR